MAITPKFEAIKVPEGWMVSIPGNMTSTGKRTRRFFPSASDADKFAASIRKKYREGRRGGVISHELAVMASELPELYGVTILELARGFVPRVGVCSSETFAERYDRAMLDDECGGKI